MIPLNTLESVERTVKSNSLTQVSLTERPSAPARIRKKKKKIVLFGHFGWGNFGNESTFQAMLCYLRRLESDAEFTCICTGPETSL